MVAEPGSSTAAEGLALAPWQAALLVAGAVLVAYANSFSVPFQFDDRVVILGEPAITGFHLDPSGRRFLGDLSFAVCYRVFGDRPAGYHAVNVAIHLANALLVMWLARSLLRAHALLPTARARRDEAIPFVAALLFAVHPLQTQAVTYVAQRYASLAAAFFLLATNAYVRFRLTRSRRASLGWYALFLGAAAAAAWTKENAFVLPLAIVLVEVAFFSAPARRRLLFVAPFLLAAAAAVGWAAASGVTLERLDTATRIGDGISRQDYALTQLRVVASYLRLLVLPVGQNLDPDVALSRSLLEPAVLLAAALHATLVAAGVVMLRRGRRGDALPSLAGFGILWFYVGLLVESSFIPIPDLMYEHRVYLPSAGLAVAAAAALARVAPLARPRVRVAVTLGLAVSLTALTVARNRVWQSELALWSDSAAKSPNKPRPLNGLGTALAAQGDLRGAIALYERALRADPSYAKAYFNLGEALQGLGEYAAAIPLYEWFLLRVPRYPDTYRNLAECYRRAGKAEAADRLDAMYARARLDSAGGLPPSLR